LPAKFSAMAPKRRASRATEKLQDDVARLGSALTGSHVSNLQEVISILQNDPEQTCKVLELLRQNALKAPGTASTEDDGDMLPPSLNKHMRSVCPASSSALNLCSKTLAREFLTGLLPAEAEEHLVEKKKAFLLDMLAFKVDMDAKSALPSKSKRNCQETFAARAMAAGRLNNIKWAEAGNEVEFWQKHGHFQVEGNELVHVSGARCKLPPELWVPPQVLLVRFNKF
jgi:hypothetical protein